MRCSVKNAKVMNGALIALDPDPRSVLFVSEGRETNPCYTASKVPKSSILHEHEDDRQTTDEMLYKMILVTKLAEDLASGVDVPTPDGRVVDKNFITEHMEYDGYIDLLKKVPENRAVIMYRKALDLAEAKDMVGFLTHLKLTYTLIRDEGLADQPDDKKRLFVPLLDRLIASEGRAAAAGPVVAILANARERSIISRVEDAVRSRGFKIVVIIFGLNHYDRLKSLIERSPVLQFDSTYSNREVSGGGKKLRRQRGRTYRRRSARKSTRRTRRS